MGSRRVPRMSSRTWKRAVLNGSRPRPNSASPSHPWYSTVRGPPRYATQTELSAVVGDRTRVTCKIGGNAQHYTTTTSSCQEFCKSLSFSMHTIEIGSAAWARFLPRRATLSESFRGPSPSGCMPQISKTWHGAVAVPSHATQSVTILQTGL